MIGDRGSVVSFTPIHVRRTAGRCPVAATSGTTAPNGTQCVHVSSLLLSQSLQRNEIVGSQGTLGCQLVLHQISKQVSL